MIFFALFFFIYTNDSEIASSPYWASRNDKKNTSTKTFYFLQKIIKIQRLNNTNFMTKNQIPNENLHLSTLQIKNIYF